MRLAIAGFHIESASFLPNAMDFDEFDRGADRGQSIIDNLKNTNTVIGGFIDVCTQENIQITPIVYAYQGGMGPVTDNTVRKYTQEIVAGLKACKDSIDGVLLHLHGAAWAPSFADVEGYILDKVRAVVGDLPVMVGFDYHGNIDANTLKNADAAFAYHESPHIDMGDTGKRTAKCMVAYLNGEISPKLVLHKPGVITPSVFSATAMQPLASIISKAREIERKSDRYIDISILAGFSYADNHNTGFSVLVVGDYEKDHLSTVAVQLSNLIYENRSKVYRPEPIYSVQDGISRALSISEQSSKPIVLLEHADRLNDSSYTLQELINRNVKNAAVPFLWDPEAAQLANKAGAGSMVNLYLGGHSSDRAGPRIPVQAKVLQTGLKKYKVSGSMLHGMPVDLGMTALLDVNDIAVSVVTYAFFGVDEDIFKVFGQNLYDYKYIVLRSKTHFRQFYQAIAQEIIVIDTPDYGPADLTVLPYKNLAKASVYPFNEL